MSGRHASGRVVEIVGIRTLLHGPTDNAPGEEIHDDCQVKPPLLRPNVRDVRSPAGIRDIDLKLPLEYVFRYRKRMLRVCGRFEATTTSRLQALLAHQTSYPFLTTADAPPAELPVNVRTSVAVLALDVDRLDLREQSRIRSRGFTS